MARQRGAAVAAAVGCHLPAVRQAPPCSDARRPAHRSISLLVNDNTWFVNSENIFCIWQKGTSLLSDKRHTIANPAARPSHIMTIFCGPCRLLMRRPCLLQLDAHEEIVFTLIHLYLCRCLPGGVPGGGNAARCAGAAASITGAPGRGLTLPSFETQTCMCCNQCRCLFGGVPARCPAPRCAGAAAGRTGAPGCRSGRPPCSRGAQLPGRPAG